MDKEFDKFWKSKSLKVGMGNIAVMPTKEEIKSFIRQREIKFMDEVLDEMVQTQAEQRTQLLARVREELVGDVMCVGVGICEVCRSKRTKLKKLEIISEEGK